MSDRVVKTDAEWQKILTPNSTGFCAGKEREPAFTGRYHDYKEKGVYRCAGAGMRCSVRKPSSIPVPDGPVFGRPFRRKAFAPPPIQGFS